jgi:folate-binding protein YgfZ
MSTAPPLPALACPADDVALLGVAGDDAESFLQGQLSNDVKALGDGQLQWSSYNSPKGRMLASLVVWREQAGHYRLLLAADLAGAIARRLRMYVLRAKAAITEDATHLLGVTGEQAGGALRAALGAEVAPGHGVITAAGAAVLALPDGRMLVAGGPDQPLPGVASGTGQMWRYARIAAGVPLVTAATSDAFVPQALNFDALGGVSFRKGCYPGQEIVARTHYLGRLKERLYAFHVDAPAPAAGTRLFAAMFGEQACGTVVNAADDPAGGSRLLAVVQRAAAEGEGDGVHLEAPDGPRLAPQPLPYPVPEPVPPRGREA